MSAQLNTQTQYTPSSVFLMASEITRGYADSLHGKPANSDDEHYQKGYAMQSNFTICHACSGSGEGMHDGASCVTCKGKGEM